MPVSVRILPRQHLVYLRYVGVMAATDNISAFGEILAHPEFRKGMRALIDLTDLEDWERDFVAIMEFGAREAFANNLLAVAGIESVLVEAESADLGAEVSDAGASLAVLCSSPKTYAELAADAIATLRAAGVGTVYLAGSPSELADPDAVDGHIRMGIDIVETLHTILDRQGVAR